MKNSITKILLVSCVIIFNVLNTTGQNLESGQNLSADAQIVNAAENMRWLIKSGRIKPDHKSVYFFEGFDEPTEAGALPEGWTQKRTLTPSDQPLNDAESPRWFRNSASYGFPNPMNYVYSGTGSMAIGYTAPDFTWAISPEFFIPETEGDVFLTYWAWIRSALPTGFDEPVLTNYFVKVKMDDQWLTLLSYFGVDGEENIFEEQIVLNMNPFKGKDVQIAFVYEYFGWQMAVDDIFVGEELQDDFGVESLTAFPTFGILPGDEVLIGVDVFCGGNNPGSVDVSLVANGQVVSTQTTGLLELGGESEFVQFTWVPSAYGDYNIQVVLPDDDFTGNNVVGRNLTVYHGYNFAEDFENFEFDDLGIPFLVFPPDGWAVNDPNWVTATQQWPIGDAVSALLHGRVEEGEKRLVTHGVELTPFDQWISFYLEGVNNAVTFEGVVQGHSTFQLKYSSSQDGPWTNLGDPIEFVPQYDGDDNLILGANALRYVEHDISDLSGTVYFAFTSTSTFNLTVGEVVYRSFVIIDNVMVTGEPPFTVVDIIAGSENHGTLLAAVLAANLQGALSGAGPFTVFAPDDDAFADLPAGLLDDLLADPSGLLTDILLYHVVPGNLLAADLQDGQVLTTLLGQNLLVTIDGDDVFINDAKVTAVDLEADNGVVHVIDAVLVPEESIVYSITIPLAAGEVPYKYFVVPVDGDPTWDLGEWMGDPNRIVNVTGDVTVEDIWGVQPTGKENSQGAQADQVYLVTFKVEMAGAIVGEGENAVAFDPELHKVFIAGGFGGDYNWNQPGSNPELEMTIGDTGVVSVEEILNTDKVALNIYPNPANSNVWIKTETSINRLEVFNITGIKVLAFDIYDSSYNLDVSDLNNGIYIVRVYTNDGTAIQKLQITR